MRARSFAIALAFAVPLQAQSLADRIQAAGDGPVAFHFAARPGVCGDGEHFIRTGRSSHHGSFSNGRPMEPCIVGPVQVRLTLENGTVNRVQSWVGPLRSREARDIGAVSRATRQDALFWLSRFASGAVAGHPNQPFAEDEEGSADKALKKHAVFVLSQLPRGEGIPQLLEIARSNPSHRVRSQALFWLGQSGDPRAITLFESVLRS